MPTVSSRHVVRFMISALWICLQLRWRRDSHFAELSLSPQPAPERMSGSASGLHPRRFVLHAWSAWTSALWSDVSPPSVIWERMRLLVFATLCGVLLDAGRLQVGETAAPFQSACEGTVWSACPQKQVLILWYVLKKYFLLSPFAPILQTIISLFTCVASRYFKPFNLRIRCFPNDFILMPLHLENRTIAFW